MSRDKSVSLTEDQLAKLRLYSNEPRIMILLRYIEEGRNQSDSIDLLVDTIYHLARSVDQLERIYLRRPV